MHDHTVRHRQLTGTDHPTYSITCSRVPAGHVTDADGNRKHWPTAQAVAAAMADHLTNGHRPIDR